MNEQTKNARYISTISELGDNGLFRSELVKVNPSNTTYTYAKAVNENVYSVSLYKLTNEGSIENVTVDTPGCISISFADYPGCSCVFGCIILKKNAE
jgi:hypothetical protein